MYANVGLSPSEGIQTSFFCSHESEKIFPFFFKTQEDGNFRMDKGLATKNKLFLKLGKKFSKKCGH